MALMLAEMRVAEKDKFSAGKKELGKVEKKAAVQVDMWELLMVVLSGY